MRPAKALINLKALEHNYLYAKARHGKRALAVIKADAYGHGALPCAQAIAPIADGFAVAFTEEAIALRQAGIQNPILVLEGAFGPDDLLAASAYGLWMTFHHEIQLEMLRKTALPKPIHAWVKVNTGMNRVGFLPDALPKAWQFLKKQDNVSAAALMTHFARADEPDQAFTAYQLSVFQQATAGLLDTHSIPKSLANSAAILAWPESYQDWARPGIMLYGADPLPPNNPAPPPLQAVMTLQSQIFAVRTLNTGESLGYGARFVAGKPTRVGLVAMGYADGYPRTAPEGTPVAVDQKMSTLIGRVSMDMLTVDLTHLPDAGIGSIVELWGAQIAVNTIADRVGAISYELLCNVKRVSRHYL